MPPQFWILGWLCQPGQVSPKFKIVAAMNAKLHISPQSEEIFLPTQTLILPIELRIKSCIFATKSNWCRINWLLKLDSCCHIHLIFLPEILADFPLFSSFIWCNAMHTAVKVQVLQREGRECVAHYTIWTISPQLF